jgi:hypothetical protein
MVEIMIPFVYAVEIAFQSKRRSQAFGKEKTINYCSWGPSLSVFATQDWKKQV